MTQTGHLHEWSKFTRERNGSVFERLHQVSPSHCCEMLANLNSDERVHVLLVEDEPLSRIYASNLVEDAGFVPIQAADADEAISILEARKDIRIVFTDINLPGSMDGLKLAHAIRHRWPPIELILTSGHFNLKNSNLPERSRFFPKPYRDEEIISALSRFAS